MNLNLGSILGSVGKWAGFGLNLIPVIGQVVALVELFKGPGNGGQKKSLAVQITALILADIQAETGKDLSHDGDVQNAVGEVIDAVVALQNLLTKKAGG